MTSPQGRPNLRTEITDLLGIQFPIVCPPMAGASCPALAAAVSLAGGLGFIAAAYETDPTRLGKDIEEATALSKGKPIGVGFITWFLDKHPNMLEVAIRLKVPVFWFSFGDYSQYAAIIKDRCPDAIIMAQIRTVAEAYEAVDRCAADVIVAQGIGAGGHGEKVGASCMSLIPEVVDAVGDRAPVIGAGGISNGRQLAASLVLGAAGAVMGTRFCASNESAFSKEAKKRLIETQDGGVATARTRAYETLRGLDWPDKYDFRVFRNDLVDSVLNVKEDPKHIESWRVKFNDAVKAKDYDVAHLAMGEGIGLVRGVWSVQRIVERTMDEAVDVLDLGAASVDRRRAKPKL
ncbi:2-nitropropane dioxygenase [Chytridium lagenaria]|nr:2-nitropropane dioxygenase [Chytridium lagenaria]